MSEVFEPPHSSRFGDYMKIKLICNQQIGDCIKTTTVAKLFKEQYPQYEIETSVSHPCVYENNPNVVNGLNKPQVFNAADQKDDKVLSVVCNQDDENGKIDNKYTINKLRENNASFTQGLVGYINAKYNFNLKVTQDEPDLYLSKEEDKPIPELPKKYWVVNTGCEKNNQRKGYPRKYWKQIFDALPDVTFVQNGLTKDMHLPFPKHDNVINGLDIYNIRQTMRMIKYSQGVITPISWNMHCAAAFHKPCIALAGGGEDVCWENYKYDGFNYLHTIGSFPCCNGGGCWKNTCENKEEDGTQKCMELIKPEIIINLIKKYGDNR